MKLTYVQQTVLNRLSKTEGKSAYDLDVRLSTLDALVDKGKATRTNPTGANYTPRIVHKYFATYD